MIDKIKSIAERVLKENALNCQCNKYTSKDHITRECGWHEILRLIDEDKCGCKGSGWFRRGPAEIPCICEKHNVQLFEDGYKPYVAEPWETQWEECKHGTPFRYACEEC